MKWYVLSVGLVPEDIRKLDPSTLEEFRRAAPPRGVGDVRAELVRGETQMRAWGFLVETCHVDVDGSADSVLRAKLAQRSWDCVMIGAGIRLIPSLTPLFEVVVNAVRDVRPRASLCFNTSPRDTPIAVARWSPTPSLDDDHGDGVPTE